VEKEEEDPNGFIEMIDGRWLRKTNPPPFPKKLECASMLVPLPQY